MTETKAKVTVRGTPDNPIFDFELPTGPKGEPGGFNAGTLLSTTENLNNITQPGLYRQQSTSAAMNPSLNYPPLQDYSNHGNPRGILMVMAWAGSSVVVQRYTTIGSGGDQATQRPRLTFERYLGTSGGWSSWSQLAVIQHVTDPVSGHKAMQLFDSDTGNWVPVTGPGGLTNAHNLGTMNLNGVTTPGVYMQNVGGRVTAESNYPVLGHAGSLVVLQWGAGATGEVIQEYKTYSNQAGTSTFGNFTRTKRGENWSPWKHTPTQRVDQTAGRVIYTWDDIQNRDQIVYGDTGWRAVTSELKNGFTGTLQVRRVNDRVSLRGTLNRPPGVSFNDLTFWDIPYAFRSDNTTWVYYPVRGAATGDTMWMYRKDIEMAFQGVPTAANTDGNQVRFDITWSTNRTWPTELPGAATAGTP